MAEPGVHILSQYAWPDDAPTALYACQLADALTDVGHRVVLVAGQGRYRQGKRSAPRCPLVRVPHVVGPRGSLVATLREYESMRAAFGAYIANRVQPGDVVIATSAPPSTPWLIEAVRRAGARSVYWLQDYYPELVRGLLEYPFVARWALRRHFDAALRRWDAVVKIAANLGYDGPNASVIRNWPTLAVAADVEVVPTSAIYSGNLGYGHHVPSLVAACGVLLDLGWTITIRADGPGVRGLPPWLQVLPLLEDEAELARAYGSAGAHLVAGHPNIDEAIFPSKVWNALATGRPVIATGFASRMRRELEACRVADPRAHLRQWVELVGGLTR